MSDTMALAPLLSVVAGSLLLLILEAFLRKDDKSYLGYLSIPFLVSGGYFCVRSWGGVRAFFEGALFLDRLSVVISLALVLSVFFIIVMSLKYMRLQDMNSGEYFPLLLLALSGMMIMVATENLLIVFLGLEVLSISSYALTGLKKNDPKSSEAAMKYFLMGSFASAFLVFGLAFLFGATGSMDIAEAVGTISSSLAGTAGLALIIIAFGFKMAFVPFHMWAPDVYEGAPTPVTSFLSIGPKLAGITVLFRLLVPYWKGLPSENPVWISLWAMAAATMALGNLAALRQRNLKRILAYSSIAHSGYILVGLLAGDGAGLFFYLIVYLFMNAGAFSVLTILGNRGREYTDVDDLAGMGYRFPWLGASFSVILFSLAGFPPTAGFLAKFLVFSSAVRNGHVSLVIIAVLASLVSVYYYLRIVVIMYMRPATSEMSIEPDNPGPNLVLFLCLYAVLQLGIWPGNLLSFIRRALENFF